MNNTYSNAISRRSILASLAAFAPTALLARPAPAAPDRCAAATVAGRARARELKARLGIDSKVCANTRADWFCEHTEELIVWEDRPDGRSAFAQHFEGRSVFVPAGGSTETRDRAFIYYGAALLYVMEPGELLAEVEPARHLRMTWAARHAFARSFSKEFFA